MLDILFLTGDTFALMFSYPLMRGRDYFIFQTGASEHLPVAPVGAILDTNSIALRLTPAGLDTLWHVCSVGPVRLLCAL